MVMHGAGEILKSPFLLLDLQQTTEPSASTGAELKRHRNLSPRLRIAKTATCTPQ